VFGRTIKIALFTLLTYLLQATTAQYISIADVAPNIALAFIAIVSVACGRKYTFVMSLTIGYLMEIMLTMLNYINLILYPVAAMLGAFVFSDKSERKLEELRSREKSTRQLNPHIRTPLCAFLSICVLEGFHLIYVNITGVQLDNGHLGRAAIDVVYTTMLAAVCQFPVRAWLGIYRQKKEQQQQE